MPFQRSEFQEPYFKGLSHRSEHVLPDGRACQFSLVNLESRFGVSAKLVIGNNSFLCDLPNLENDRGTCRPHLLTFDSDNPDFPNAEAVLNDWTQALLFFESRMTDLAPDTSLDDLRELLTRGKLPRPQTAELSERGKLLYVLERLGLGDEYGHTPWRTLVETAASGAITEAWRSSNYVQPPLVEPSYLVNVEGIDFYLLFAAFYNNAPSPGGSSGERLAHAYKDVSLDLSRIEAAEAPISPTELARSVFSEISPEIAIELIAFDNLTPPIDYYRGRRLKLFVLMRDGVPHLNTLPFDQCAFEGAGAVLVERIRRGGFISCCIRYSEDSEGLTKGELIEDQMWQ